MKNKNYFLNISVRIALIFMLCVLVSGIASADNIFSYPDWVLAGEEPPEGYEIVDGEVLYNGTVVDFVEPRGVVSNSVYYITNKQHGKYI